MSLSAVPPREPDAEPAAGPALEVADLVKRYPKRPVNAVDGVSFSVHKGEVFGLLGPNGAGKTTTVGVLTTRVRPTSGRALVAGIDVALHPVEAKRRLAVVPQRVNLDRSLTARQNLTFHAAYFGVPAGERNRRADALLQQFGLTDRANDKVDFYSGGQTQRIMIARALMHQPEVLFLDEPTTGLDPQSRLFLWDRVNEMRGRGVTMVLTTHDMDEATTLCDRVGIMDRGKLLALDTPEALTATIPGKNSLGLGIKLNGANADGLIAQLGQLAGVERVDRVTAAPGGAGGGPGRPGAPGRPGGGAAQPPAADPSRLDARVHATIEAPALVAPVAALVTAAGATLVDLSIGKPSLEDVFIHLTGRALR